MNRRPGQPPFYPSFPYDHPSNTPRNEEKERQREEARRALREQRGRAGASPPQDKEVIFAVVPQNSAQDKRFSNILGEYSEQLSKRYRLNELVGVDPQPPTPAPSTSSHDHDPDTYTPPAPLPSSAFIPRKQPDYNPYGSHGGARPHVGGSGPPRLAKPPAPLHKSSYHPHKFVEEVKPSLKSGPGPGPGSGPGVRPRHQDRLPSGLNGGHGRGRPRSHEKVKDPQVQRIMHEMSDLKTPVSAIIQTPRPDHQNTFTFPPTTQTREPPSGFRQPQEPHQKSGKTSEGRPPSAIQQRALESSLHDEFPLAEESDEELGRDTSRVPESTVPGSGVASSRTSHASVSKDPEPCDGSKLPPPVSPLKNTDESSNSEESSCTDTESSSTEDEEERQTPPPTSPLPSDSNPWSLESIFQQSTNNKDDEPPAPEVVGHKGFSEPAKELKPEPMVPSPHTVDEPAPPVVTTMPPYAQYPKSSEGAPSCSLCSATTDENSDEECRVAPKSQKAPRPRANSRANSKPAYKRPNKQATPTKRKIFEPNLSSDSEDEEPPKPARRVSQSHPSKFTRGLPTMSLQQGGKEPHAKAPEKKDVKKEAAQLIPEKKDIDHAPSDGDPDGHGCIDVVNTPRGKSSPKKATPNISVTPSRESHSRRSGPGSHRSETPHKSPKKTGLTSPSSAGDLEHPHQHKIASYKETKHSVEARRPPSKERDGRPERDAKRPLPKETPTHPSNGTPAHSRREKERPQQHQEERVEKRRKRSRRESEGRRSERTPAADEGVPTSIMPQRPEEHGPSGRLSAPSPSRKGSHGSSHNNKVPLPHIHYENGVPKLICSIPFHLIDKLPSGNSLKECVQDAKVNKEVLEMRTSGGMGKEGIKKERTGSSKSPPNEDETKLRAIRSIYRKKESSLEPEKIKREVKSESQEDPHEESSSLEALKREVKTEAPELNCDKTTNLKAEETISKQEKKPQPKEELKSSSLKGGSEGSLKRHGSSSSISSLGTVGSVGSHSHSHRKHKREKKKEQDQKEPSSARKEEHDKAKEQAIELEEASKRRKRAASPQQESSTKRTKGQEASQEGSRTSSKGTAAAVGTSTNAPKKPLLATPGQEEERHVASPADHVPRDSRLSPHPLPHGQPHLPSHSRTSQRNVSEDRPGSALSSEATHPPYQPRVKPPSYSVSCQPSQKGLHLNSPYPDHGSEDDFGEGAQRGGHVFPSVREKVLEEHLAVATSGVEAAGYNSLPSSEHGNATYRPGEDRVSPPLGLGAHPHHQLYLMGCGQMYPPINPSPNTTAEYNNPLLINHQDATSAVPVYTSYFDKQTPESKKDAYLNRAKELKHQGDKEPYRLLKMIIYLESALYFIMTGESIECNQSASTMYLETIDFLRHVPSPIFMAQNAYDRDDNRLSVILKILSLRCQSLLSLKLYKMKHLELKEAQHFLSDFLKNSGRQPPVTPSVTLSSSSGVGTPSGVPRGSSTSWGNSHQSAANNSPSSLSPTPSPTGSVGSEGSQSSGYTTEGPRQPGNQQPPVGATPPQVTPMISVPADVHTNMLCHCRLTSYLTNAYDIWNESIDYIHRSMVEDFFMDLDHAKGSLSFHSSLKELVSYVHAALEKLKKLV